MRVYVATGALLAASMLALFALAEGLAVSVLADESPDLGPAGAGAALAALALLTVDSVLPVPSSAVMVANGALFGPVAGALLSLAGSQGAALTCFAIGRSGGALVDRAARRDGRGRASVAAGRGGALTVALSRPVPVVAETVAILAGAAGMPLRRLVLATAIGSLPPAAAYALAGAMAARFGEATYVFAGVMALTALMWLGERLLDRGRRG